MKKIYIHAGPGKSGTSAIQSFLAKNIRALERVGFSYPDIDSIDESINGGVTGGNSASLARSFLNSDHPFSIKNDIESKDIQYKFDRLLKNSNSNLILSSELFSMLNKEDVEDLKSFINQYDYEVFCVFYLRRHDQIVESDYAQQVKKHGYSDLIDSEFYKHIISAYDFYRIINAFKYNFGEASIIVRAYEKTQFVNNNLLDDFLSSIGLYSSRDLFLFDSNIVNPSPSRSMLEIMRVVNGFDNSLEVNKKLLDVVFGNEAFQKKHTDSYISYQSKLKILSACDPMYKKIAKEFFNREKLFHSDLVPYELEDISSKDIVSAFLKLI